MDKFQCIEEVIERLHVLKDDLIIQSVQYDSTSKDDLFIRINLKQKTKLKDGKI